MSHLDWFNCTRIVWQTFQICIKLQNVGKWFKVLTIIKPIQLFIIIYIIEVSTWLYNFCNHYTTLRIIEIVKQPNILFLSFFFAIFSQKTANLYNYPLLKKKNRWGELFHNFLSSRAKIIFLRLNIHLRTSAPLSNQLENHLVFSQTSLVKKEWNSAICCVAINTLDITDYPA